MILHDSHLHSDFSSDCQTSMELTIKKGIALGLESICFTDHMDYDFPKQYSQTFTFDPLQYQQQITSLQDKYQIQIRRGIELGLKPSAENQIHNLLASHSYDYVIGSIHIVDECDPYYPEYWNHFPENHGILRYLEATLDAVTSYNDFDSLGHLDYIIRYLPSQSNIDIYPLFTELIDEILISLVKKEKALEINTAGFKQGFGYPNPRFNTLSRFLELGGEYVTIGSDAHTPEYVAYQFKELSQLLQKNGLRHYTIYQHRKPENILF